MVVHAALRLRQIVNVVNLSSPAGVLVARVGCARLRRGPDGLIRARGYRLPVPAAPAFTLGNVILLKIDDDQLARRPRVLVHEARHATQYATCLVIVMVPLYLLASAWSWLRCRDFATHNVFERWAGLADGGYHVRTPRHVTHGRALSPRENHRGGEGRGHGTR